MISFGQQSMILLLLLLLLRFKDVSAVSCEDLGIRSHLENTTLVVNFDSNEVLKADREVLCPSAPDWVSVTGCTYSCPNLTYGETYEVSVKIVRSADETAFCGIDVTLPLQPPSVVHLNVTDNLVYLTVQPPLGSFDFFTVRCPNDSPWQIFSRELTTVTCPVIPRVPLMNIILETVKGSLQSAVTSITQEVPLEVPFTFTTNDLLLSINAEAPPLINLRSTYEISLGFYADDAENTYYQRRKFYNSDPTIGSLLTYGILPNLTHEIAATHTVESLGSVTTKRTFTRIWTSAYPFNVTNLIIREEFDDIFVSWTDPHSFLEPIGFSIICNSRTNFREFLDKAVNHTCRSMRLNETESITVITEVNIPNTDYHYPHIAITSIDVSEVPDLPLLEIASAGENTITVQWDYETIPSPSFSFSYNIHCGSNQTAEIVDIFENYYQCTSLEPGKLYVIKMFVSNNDNSIQRSISMFASTTLAKSQYQHHYYVTNDDGSHSVLIEWSPANGEYDAIHVQCPSNNITFEYYQLQPVMYAKCAISKGIPFTVNIWTAKNGYQWVAETFTGLLSNDPTPTTAPSTSTTTTTTTTTITTATTAGPAGTTAPSIVTVTPLVTTGMTSSTTSRSALSDPTSTIPLTSTNNTVTVNTRCREELNTMEKQMTKWRIIAIIALIVDGFLFLMMVGLLIFSIFVCLRSK